jgi:hypothetical protein
MLIGSRSFGVDGLPFVWDNSHPIQYRTDSGPLGTIDNATANSLLAQAFAQWTQVPTAALTVQSAGTILGVTNGHVSSVADFNTVAGSCSNGDQSPVIYDSTGNLFSQLIGDASVIGFTSICDLNPNGHIQSALIVLTGGSGLSSAQQSSVMTHEIGHLFGLDHSLPGVDPCGTSSDDIAALPIMYFQLTSQTALTQDDKAWISTLYPSASYNSVYGTIAGQVFFSDGQNGVQDVLVAAHPISSGSMAGENRAIAISSISGYRFTGNPGQPYTADYLACTPASECPHGFYGNNVDGSQFGSRMPALIGWFEIPVPAGSYAVEISSINDGGVVGPNNPIIQLPGPGEYWNTQESASDPDFSTINCSTPRVLDAVVVQAGTPANGINFIMNRTAPAFDIFDSPPGQSPNLVPAILPSPLFMRETISTPAGKK